MRVLQPSPMSVLLIGAGAGALGLLWLLARRRSGRGGWALGAAVAAAVAAAALGGAALGLPELYWLPALALAALAGLGALLRWPGWRPAAAGTANLLSRPWLQGGLLVLLAPVLIVWQASQLNVPDDLSDLTAAQDARLLDLRLTDEPVGWAVSDAGRRLPLYTVDPEYHDQAASVQEETDYLSRHDLLMTAIRLAGPSLDTNCHGWVFSGGRAWVRGAEVDDILNDNGYAPASLPRPGDLAVFRRDDGAPEHTALVHSLGPDGKVILESKWGALGRFLHTRDRNPYSHLNCTYYHSERPGHLLRGLTTPEPRPSVAGL
jgi:hypothetical protein